MRRLYVIRVDIAEAATGYAYPVVRHEFIGRTRAEARRYLRSHLNADAFLRGCVERGSFARGKVRCAASLTEGWRNVR